MMVDPPEVVRGPGETLVELRVKPVTVSEGSGSHGM